jgi:hypothetical protein
MNTMIEMYDRIMSVVEEVTGISKDKILTSNCEECVDARHILVYWATVVSQIIKSRSLQDLHVRVYVLYVITLNTGVSVIL